MRTCVWLYFIISKTERWNNERKWRFALNCANQPINFKLLRQVYGIWVGYESYAVFRQSHKLFKDAWKLFEDDERIFSINENIALCNILNKARSSKIKNISWRSWAILNYEHTQYRSSASSDILPSLMPMCHTKHYRQLIFSVS